MSTQAGRTVAARGTGGWPRKAVLIPIVPFSLVLTAACGCETLRGATTETPAAGTATPPVAQAQPAGPAQPAAPSLWQRVMFWDTPTPPVAVDSLILHGDRLEEEVITNPDTARQMAAARELYRQCKYADAQAIFHAVSENKKNPVQIGEEATFYDAECLRLQKLYPAAADTYNRLFTADFPNGVYREPALQHMFEIADYWLDDTRAEMAAAKASNSGHKWFNEGSLFHWDKTKPFMDEEGRALETLERVRYNDITGPLADKALFLAGSVRFYREDYREADHCFSQIVEMHPNSPLVPRAVELGIISKHMSTGGPLYDARKVAEARQMVHIAMRTELGRQKPDFLERQLIGINLQEAEKDYLKAEFYLRTGHPESAYFCYEIVRRRYPGTKFFDLATDRMQELRGKAQREKGVSPPEVPAPSVAKAPPPHAPGVPPARGAETAPAPHKRGAPASPNQLPEIDEPAPAPRKAGQ